MKFNKPRQQRGEEPEPKRELPEYDADYALTRFQAMMDTLYGVDYQDD